MGNQTQKDKVLAIVKDNQPIRTEQAEIIGLRVGISGGSVGRYLRWLQAENEVYGKREKGDKTHTWRVKETFEGGLAESVNNIQDTNFSATPELQLTLSFIKANNI